jgi:glucosylceramidase
MVVKNGVWALIVGCCPLFVAAACGSSGNGGNGNGSSGGSGGGSSSSSGSISGSSSGGPVVGPDGGKISGVELFETSPDAGAGNAPEHLADKGQLMVGGTPAGGITTITIDPTKKLQTIAGFGAAITESVAYVINSLPADQQQQVFTDFFDPVQGSGYTIVRTHIGSCDMAMTQYSLDDVNCPPSATPPAVGPSGGGTSTTRGPCTTPDPGWASSQTLANFSIDHDTTPQQGVAGSGLLVPALKRAIQTSGGALKILASPWSAPPWMKSNGMMQGTSGQDGVVQPQYYQAFAVYLSDYIKAYTAAGVPIWAITPANEPLGVGASRESMVWNSGNMNTFLKTNLGPQLKKDGTDSTLVFIFDHNKGDNPPDALNWAQTIYGDNTTNPFVAGEAVHWYGSTVQTYDGILDMIHSTDPSKMILFDEGTADELGDVGFGRYSASFYLSWMKDAYYYQKDDKDWGFWYAGPSCATPTTCGHPPYEAFYRYTRDIIHGLNHWYNGWVDWTAILNRDGGPEHVFNPIPTTIMVDPTTSPPTLYYSPNFYVMRSFSKYFRPGAQVLTTTVNVASDVKAIDYDGMPTQDGGSIMATSAVNPDGTIAVQVFNETGSSIQYAIVNGSQSVTTTSPPQSLQTIVWAAH